MFNYINRNQLLPYLLIRCSRFIEFLQSLKRLTIIKKLEPSVQTLYTQLNFVLGWVVLAKSMQFNMIPGTFNLVSKYFCEYFCNQFDFNKLQRT